MLGSPLRYVLPLSVLAFALPAKPGGPPAATRVAAVDSTLLKAYRWRNVGPDRGGRSIAISGVKGRPKEAYVGATGGGLWKTTDGGENWTPVTDGQIRSASVGASRPSRRSRASSSSPSRNSMTMNALLSVW